MIGKTGGEVPFSRYGNLMKKKPVVATSQQTTSPVQVGIQQQPFKQVGGFASPELEGMKHTMDRGMPGKRGGVEVERQRPMMQQKPILPETQPNIPGITSPGGTTIEVPEDQHYQIPTDIPGIITDPKIGLPPERTTPESTIGGGFSEETAPEWGTEDYQQGMYNLAREQISGQTAADTEYARTQLGGRGLRAGESGIANKALMNIRRQGAETLGQESRKMAMQGMGARYGQQQDLMNMIMNKYGIDTQAQQRRFDPYYNVEQQYAGQV